ncbi:putative nucleic acid-binding Zn-ribbon protein [Bradyrhizobium sp. USDA 4463]
MASISSTARTPTWHCTGCKSPEEIEGREVRARQAMAENYGRNNTTHPVARTVDEFAAQAEKVSDSGRFDRTLLPPEKQKNQVVSWNMRIQRTNERTAV